VQTCPLAKIRSVGFDKELQHVSPAVRIAYITYCLHYVTLALCIALKFFFGFKEF
jgi:hypothetical protein